MSIDGMISAFDAMFEPVHDLSTAALANYMSHPSEHAELLSNAADDLYDAITTGLAALQRIHEYTKEVKPA